MKAQSVGWDLHRKFSQVTVMEQAEDGQMAVRERARLEHEDREGMRQ